MRQIQPAVPRATMLAALALALAWPATAQRAAAGAAAVGLVTHAAPALAGQALTEAYLTQPLLSARAEAFDEGVTAHVMVNLEAWTLERGELNAGVWGEGYIDRRHPHTVLHEAMLVASLPAGRWQVSVAGGRGFAPFGTDDPMARPFVKYPANHHHAQILERWVVAAALRRGSVAAELGLLNGDEPAGPTDLGQPRRLGDSQSARLTWRPRRGWELQTSGALLRSPEIPGGGGLDQRKLSASARWEGSIGGGLRGYALVEAARTRELAGGEARHAFGAALAEASIARGPWLGALRVERNQRPEEERGFDAFRTPRPHAGPRLGVTEWTIGSVHVRRHSHGSAGVEPFAEASLKHVREIGSGVFEPGSHYGGTALWNLSAGFRVHAGMRHVRVGRYGAAGHSDENGHHH